MWRIAVATASLLFCCLVSGADEPRKAVEAGALDALWDDLASPDEGKATRAALALASRPADAVTLLRERLRPVKLSEADSTRLIDKLGAEEFTDREAAASELEYYGKFIKADLEKALGRKPAAEVAKRIKQLLDRMPVDPGTAPPPTGLDIDAGRSISISNAAGKLTILVDGKPLDLTPKALPVPVPPRGWARAVRAVAVLEHVGTSDAEKLVRRMSEGERDAQPTRAAREALARWKK